MRTIEFDPQPVLKPEDAHRMGMSFRVGLALPNAESLWTPADAVDPEAIAGPVIQHEEQRLLQAANNIAYTINKGRFGGLAHSQLQMPEGQKPLQMILAAVEVPGAKTVQYEDTVFSLLYNTKFETEDSDGNQAPLSELNEGCYSSGNTSVREPRPTAVYDIRAHNSDGEPIRLDVVSGHGSFSLQHECDHGLGERVADPPGTRRDLVSPSEFPAHKAAIIAGEVWTPQLSDAGWYDFSRNPDYDYFPTLELRDAFEAGKAGLPL